MTHSRLHCGDESHPSVRTGLRIGSSLSAQLASPSGIRVWLESRTQRRAAACAVGGAGFGRPARELAIMATLYQGNVPTMAQSTDATGPVIRTIQLSDLHEALKRGWEDFKAVPSHAIILCVI